MRERRLKTAKRHFPGPLRVRKNSLRLRFRDELAVKPLE